MSEHTCKCLHYGRVLTMHHAPGRDEIHITISFPVSDNLALLALGLNDEIGVQV